jgi:hypothetical protein
MTPKQQEKKATISCQAQTTPTQLHSLNHPLINIKQSKQQTHKQAGKQAKLQLNTAVSVIDFDADSNVRNC